MQIVIFNLGGEKYAVETSRVQGIDKMMDITKVPCADKSIKGLVNLRGNIISILDPYVILGIEDGDQTPENIIIMETEEELLGIIVDKVAEVVEIDSRSIEDISTSREDDRKYIEGTVNMGDYLVTLINIHALLSTK